MQCVMSKQRMVLYDKNTNIKSSRCTPLLLYSLLSCFTHHIGAFIWLYLKKKKCFSVCNSFQCVQPNPLCHCLSTSPLCMSAASFWPDPHNLWSSILYTVEVLWCTNSCGSKVPLGMWTALCQAHTWTQTHKESIAAAVIHWHKPPLAKTHMNSTAAYS